MKFLILSRLPDIYSTRRLVQEVESRGHNALVKNPEDSCEAQEFDILIPRLGQFRYDEAMTNLQKLESQKIARGILNSSEYFQNARHKKQASLILSNLPQPKLFPRPTQFPIVVKDCLSSQGEGVFLCKSEKELNDCLYKLQGREVLFQEFIQESQGHDIRAFVIGHKVMAAMERVSKDPATEFRSNLSLGGSAHPTFLTEQEEGLCVAAVRKLKLDYAGVDFVRSQRGPLILEVNPCPGLEGIEHCSQANIAKEVVLYAESLLGSDS